MSKRPPASVHLHVLSLGDVDVMCKAKKPASMSVMQYACKGVLKCAYLNPKYMVLITLPKALQQGSSWGIMQSWGPSSNKIKTVAYLAP